MKNIALLATATVALVAFLIVWESSPQLFLRETRPQLNESPRADSYMRETFTRKFSETGALSYTLDSTRGEYFKKGDRMELQQPKLVAFSEQADEQPWHLNANKSVIFNTKNRVVMSGKVHAWQKLAAEKNQLRTPKLVFFPDTSVVQTQSRVELISPTSTTTARGLTANLEQQNYRLLAQVKTVYQTP